MTSIRLPCGATIDAARELLKPATRQAGRRALNLLGGFHHAKRDVPGGFCPVTAVAVALAAVRAEGFRGGVLVIDLDAHPPDGTADCLAGDPAHSIGSLSGSDWGELKGVDETVLPEGTGDEGYLRALRALLERMPPGELAFVCAGGDVLAGDPLGKLGLTVGGCRERDLLVADPLLHVPSVWLPSGGYTPDAWRVLAGTGLALGVRSRAPIPRKYDPLVAKFSSIARSLAPEDLGGDFIDADDVERDLRLAGGERKLFLGFYSAEGLEHALHRYGLLGQLKRLVLRPLPLDDPPTARGLGSRLVAVPTCEAEPQV